MEHNLSKLTDDELTTEELNAVTGSGLWDAIMAVFHGGADASHKHEWREGGGRRGA